MNNLILFAPACTLDSLVELTGITRVPLPQGGSPTSMKVSDIRPMIETETHVAVTANTDAMVIRSMFETLNDLSGDLSTVTVCAEEPLPADIRAALPEFLQPLLRRPLPRDLIIVSAHAIRSVDEESMIDFSVMPGTISLALSGAPAIDRFPLLGPDAAQFQPANLRSVIRKLLAAQQLEPLQQRCVESGLLLLWDFLDESHQLSQSMEGVGSPRTGDYWHGIMHRREPDAGNAAYWFRRVGRHPALESLGENLTGWMSELGATSAQRELASRKLVSAGAFDPFAMIQMTEKAMLFPESEQESTCRMVQFLEMLNLLASSFRNR